MRRNAYLLTAMFLVSVCACDDKNGGAAGDGGGGSGGDGGDSGVVYVPPDANPNIPPDGSTAYQDDGGIWMCGVATCECSDTVDNDGDGLIDYPADPDCVGYWDTTETAGSGCGSTQCTNCLDDDGDGLIDSADPECTGPLDNREDTFATGIPGDNLDCKQDCFFDGNSGSGDDHCEWQLGCDPLLGPSNRCKRPNGPNACTQTQTQGCVDYCRPLTPNGCDCFGCCTVFDSGGTGHTVRIDPNSGCTTAVLSDATKCPVCTKNTACENTCDACEFCLGRAPAASCTAPDAGTTLPACAYGRQACDPTTNNCPDLYYCLTGCCIPRLQ